MNSSNDGGQSGTPDDTAPAGSNMSSLPGFLEYRAAMTIWAFWPPSLLLVGGFGNIATVFVMRRIKDHNSSQHVILMALAMSDLMLLYSACLHGWIRHTFVLDLLTEHTAVCKFLLWVIYASGTTSAWLVTCVTVQRTMAVLWPHRMRVMCTVRRTWIAVVTLVPAACLLDFHLVVGMEVNPEKLCMPMPGMYEQFLNFVFSWVDLCASAIVPSVFLFVCDVILSVALFRAFSSSVAARAKTSVSSTQDADSRRKMSYRTTIMVLLIACAFLVLTTPICIAQVWNPYVSDDINTNPQRMAEWMMIDAITHQLWYTNSAINFFLYCLTGTKFRREFIGWISCGAQSSSSAPSVRETASETSRGGRYKAQHNAAAS